MRQQSKYLRKSAVHLDQCISSSVPAWRCQRCQEAHEVCPRMHACARGHPARLHAAAASFSSSLSKAQHRGARRAGRPALTGSWAGRWTRAGGSRPCRAGPPAHARTHTPTRQRQHSGHNNSRGLARLSTLAAARGGGPQTHTGACIGTQARHAAGIRPPWSPPWVSFMSSPSSKPGNT